MKVLPMDDNTAEQDETQHPSIISKSESTTTMTDTNKIPKEFQKQYYFGCGPCHPKWMQIFARKKFFTFMMWLYILIHGAIVTGFTSANVSTLEKRYSFSSTLAAVYVVMYDVFLSGSIIFISYFGGKSHKPRVMGISLVILSIGSIVVASPQFFFGSYKFDISTNSQLYEECNVTAPAATDIDDECTPANIGAYVILLIGQALVAIGSSAVYTVALAYIDEIVYPKYISLHMGAVLIGNTVGPALGYLIGSAFLSIYVDPWRQTQLDPTDPAWVGAWWIGPLLAGVFGLMLSTLFFMYPRWLSDSHLVRKERAKEMAKKYPKDSINDDNLTLIVKQFPTHIMQLLLNPSLMATAFGLAALILIRDGVISFGAKYVESMFSTTASVAGFIAGGIGITGAVIGVVTGAALVYLWQPVGRRTTVIQTVVVAICIPFVLVFLIKCPTANVAGITVPYNDGSFDGRDSSSCSLNCSCQSSVYEPVCGDDGITYFSPCRAGCRVDQLDDESYIFTNCTCMNANISSSGIQSNSTFTNIAEEGICSSGCNNLIYFVIVLFVLMSLILVIEIPYYHYALRVVADEQRHLALGLQSAIFRGFGSIPGPLLFGGIIDLACVEWDYNCGIRGNCWIYDHDKLSLYAILLCLPFAVLSVLLLFVGMLTYPKKQEVDEEE